MSTSALEILTHLQDATKPNDRRDVITFHTKDRAQTIRTYPELTRSPSNAAVKWTYKYAGSLSNNLLLVFTPGRGDEHLAMLAAFLAATNTLAKRASEDTSAYFQATAAIALEDRVPSILDLLRSVMADKSVAQPFDGVIEIHPNRFSFHNRGISLKKTSPEAVLSRTILDVMPSLPVHNSTPYTGRSVQSIVGDQAEILHLETTLRTVAGTLSYPSLLHMQEFFEKLLPAYTQHGITQRRVMVFENDVA